MSQNVPVGNLYGLECRQIFNSNTRCIKINRSNDNY